MLFLVEVVFHQVYQDNQHSYKDKHLFLLKVHIVRH